MAERSNAPSWKGGIPKGIEGSIPSLSSIQLEGIMPETKIKEYIIFPDTDNKVHLEGLPGLTLCFELPWTAHPEIGGKIYKKFPKGKEKCPICFGE